MTDVDMIADRHLKMCKKISHLTLLISDQNAEIVEFEPLLL